MLVINDNNLYTVNDIYYSISKKSEIILKSNKNNIESINTPIKILFNLNLNDITSEWIVHYSDIIQSLRNTHGKFIMFFININHHFSKNLNISLIQMNFNYVLFNKNFDYLDLFISNKKFKEKHYNILSFHNFNIHLHCEKVYYKEFLIDIKEGKTFELFLFFVQNNNKVLSKEYIFEKLWKDKYNTSNFNVIEVLIGNIRKELLNFISTPVIVTVPRKGYMFSYGKNHHCEYLTK